VFPQVTFVSPPHSDIYENYCKLLNVRALKSKSLFIRDHALRNDIVVFMLTETCSNRAPVKLFLNARLVVIRIFTAIAVIKQGGFGFYCLRFPGCTEVYMSHGSTFKSLVVHPSNPKAPLNVIIYRPSSTHVA